MTWISKGEPIHRCTMPKLYFWTTGTRADGWGVLNGTTTGTPKVHIYPGAVWECDECAKRYVLDSGGGWGVTR